ncbi:MAG: hypothetical protein R3F13_12535 [Prosthecobacter sp.]
MPKEKASALMQQAGKRQPERLCLFSGETPRAHFPELWPRTLLLAVMATEGTKGSVNGRRFGSSLSTTPFKEHLPIHPQGQTCITLVGPHRDLDETFLIRMQEWFRYVQGTRRIVIS